MQISGIGNVDENKAKLVLAFVEKLEQFGMGLSLREIEATGAAVTREIQLAMAKAAQADGNLSGKLKAMSKDIQQEEDQDESAV